MRSPFRAVPVVAALVFAAAPACTGDDPSLGGPGGGSIGGNCTSAQKVYWGNDGVGDGSHSLRRAEVDAPACDGVACELIASVGAPVGIVLDDKAVYWVDAATAGGVYKRAK